MKNEIKFSLLLLLSTILFTGCLEFGPNTQQNPLVKKEDFQSIWRLNSIEIEGTRNGEKTLRSFTGSSFQDNNGNIGSARIEFLANGNFQANLHINSEATGPIEETIQGEAFFSSNAMHIEAPGKVEWDRLAFKINLEHELYVEIKNYDKAVGGPFDNFYDHLTAARESIRLRFVEFNN